MILLRKKRGPCIPPNAALAAENISNGGSCAEKVTNDKEKTMS